MSARLNATAVVTLTIEVPADGCWGGDCSMAQIDKQARESVLMMFVNPIGAQRLHTLFQAGRLRVIGTPQVTTLLVKESR